MVARREISSAVKLPDLGVRVLRNQRHHLDRGVGVVATIRQIDRVREPRDILNVVDTIGLPLVELCFALRSERVACRTRERIDLADLLQKGRACGRRGV